MSRPYSAIRHDVQERRGDLAWSHGAAYRWDEALSLGPRRAQPSPGASAQPGRCPMATTSTSTAVATVESVFTEPERLALAGFLAGYTGLTREAYALDLRQFASWCQQHHIGLFQARRADIECFARDLEARGRARATITRRLCTVTGLYRHAVEEELLDHSPAAHVRRPGPTMSHTPPGWTGTNSAQYWSPPGSALPPSMR